MKNIEILNLIGCVVGAAVSVALLIIAYLLRKARKAINHAPYHFPMRYINGDCTAPCKVKNNGVMIGSCLCQECPNNRGFNIDEGWIKCSQLTKATAINPPENTND